MGGWVGVGGLWSGACSPPEPWILFPSQDTPRAETVVPLVPPLLVTVLSTTAPPSTSGYHAAAISNTGT